MLIVKSPEKLVQGDLVGRDGVVWYEVLTTFTRVVRHGTDLGESQFCAEVRCEDGGLDTRVWSLDDSTKPTVPIIDRDKII